MEEEEHFNVEATDRKAQQALNKKIKALND